MSLLILPLLTIFKFLQNVYLVGGFAASPYLVTSIRDRLSPFRISVTTPDGQTYAIFLDRSLYLVYSKKQREGRVGRRHLLLFGP